MPRVTNPLSVVAIFSALAETFAIYCLIKLPPEIQVQFVYFVMAFPVFIVSLFFATLNWNHTVLYAPGDFENEEMYIESIRVKREQLTRAVESTMQSVVADTSLTEDEKNRISQALRVEVARTSMDSRKESILAFLADGEKSSSEIASECGLSMIYTYRLLGEMLADGRVIQRKVGSKAYWSGAVA